jgi:hypothetical protein
LNDPSVVALVAKNCVPIALNADRLPGDAAGDLFRKVIESSHWPQGIWVLSPDGKVLAFHYFKAGSGESSAASKKRWARETAAAIAEGLKAFGPVQPRAADASTLLADRGVGKAADGGVRLAVTGTFLLRGRREDDPLMDSIALSAKQWHALVPAQFEAGFAWDLPETTARAFVPALCPITDSIYSPLPPDATTAQLHAVVDSTKGDHIWLRLDGRWETKHLRDPENPKTVIRTAGKAEGMACCDRTTKQMLSLLLVFHGTFRSIPPWDQSRDTAAIVEWQSAAPGKSEK